MMLSCLLYTSLWSFKQFIQFGFRDKCVFALLDLWDIMIFRIMIELVTGKTEFLHCFGYRIISVSYTHLDVYKRQVECIFIEYVLNAQCGFLEILRQFNGSFHRQQVDIGFITPVSYTHLDVYKRQAIHSMNRLCKNLFCRK